MKLRPVLCCFFVALTILAFSTTTLKTSTKSSQTSAGLTLKKGSQATELKTLSEQLMNSVAENKTEKIEGLARQVVTIAKDLVRDSKSKSQKDAAQQILQNAKAIQQIGKDGTIAENGMLLEKLHQQVLKYLEGDAPSAKLLGNTLCPVSGQPVGSMQNGSHIVYKGQEIGLCCDGCKSAFLKDPAANLKRAKKSVPQ